MQKIGEYWVPEIDAREGYNLERTRYGFENGEGVQVKNLYDALDVVDRFDVAIDGGANVGSWSRVLARYFSQVHAFEPYPPAFECLERNISEWGLDEKVRIYNVALSEDNKGVSVEPAGEGRRTVTCSVTGEGSIPAISIDQIKLPTCSFLKLDVEGYEAKALLGAKQTIRTFVPWIMIENKRTSKSVWDKRTDAEKLLSRWRYKLVAKYGDRQIDWLFRGPKQ